jgi:triphosphatase
MRLIKTGRDIARLSDADLHHLRIQAKKLRYATEAFAPLLDRKMSVNLLNKLKLLQTHLGNLNDAVVAARLVKHLALSDEARDAAKRVLADRRSRKAKCRAAAIKLMRDLPETPLPWVI